MIVIGVAMVMLALFLSFRRTDSGRGRDGDEEEDKRKTEVKGGGVILIGPIPIVFGSDARWAAVAIVLAIALIVVSFLLEGWRL